MKRYYNDNNINKCVSTLVNNLNIECIHKKRNDKSKYVKNVTMTPLYRYTLYILLYKC